MKRFERFAHRQFKSLICDLKEYRDRKKSETLHEIRIDIKKIKAILGLLNASEKQFKAHKNFIPFRNIFRKAGKIRDADVHEHLLRNHEMDKDHCTIGDVSRQKQFISFASNIQSFIKTVKRQRNKLEPDLKRVKKNDLSRYLRKQQEEIKSQLFPRPKMRYIHKTRKAVKEVVYLSEPNGSLTSNEINFYDKIQKKIGELHDKQVLLQLLKRQNDQDRKTKCEVTKTECLSDKKEISHLAIDFYRQNARNQAVV